MTLAQAEVGAKTNETTHFQPLLGPLDLAETVATFDALHSVRRTSPGWSRARMPTTSP
ncbi:hypothetical protein ACWKT5_08860 [Streptomyces avermitilis]